ncbi:MAG: DUF3310 domain-containing protein, partial [Candidatus Poseidoniales archaeon]
MTNQDSNWWEEDGISMTGNPYYSPDTLYISGNVTGSNIASELEYDSIDLFSSITGSGVFGGDRDDVISDSPAIPWKYNEEEIVKELLEYVRGTYNQHYSAGDDKIQTLDLIEACGDGEAFCRSNILKYASRYDKKGTARRDIMKILHYA